jgi:hypothetical protein
LGASSDSSSLLIDSDDYSPYQCVAIFIFGTTGSLLIVIGQTRRDQIKVSAHFTSKLAMIDNVASGTRYALAGHGWHRGARAQVAVIP